MAENGAPFDRLRAGSEGAPLQIFSFEFLSNLKVRPFNPSIDFFRTSKSYPAIL
jgi:hypothetical protein